MLKAVFFDLDGTLIHMDEKKFLEIYFGTMESWMRARGYDGERIKIAEVIDTIRRNLQ